LYGTFGKLLKRNFRKGMGRWGGSCPPAEVIHGPTWWGLGFLAIFQNFSANVW